MSMVCTAKSTYIPELDTRAPAIVLHIVSIATLGNLDVNRLTVTDNEEPVGYMSNVRAKPSNLLRNNSTLKHFGVGFAERD